MNQIAGCKPFSIILLRHGLLHLYFFHAMICISNYDAYCNGNVTIITGMEEFVCPVCGGNEYKVHGTCCRKVRTREGTRRFRLRILRCCGCGRTHRELPEGIIPYRRFCAESLAEIAEADPQAQVDALTDNDPVDYEYNTWRRIRRWLSGFIRYAQFITESLRLSGLYIPAEKSGKKLSEQLSYFVRLVVNSGNWQQHRSVLSVS